MSSMQPHNSTNKIKASKNEANISISEIETLDAYGRTKLTKITGEFPLTIYLNRFEIVTLMTLGVDPEHLALGYLLNQGLLTTPDDIASVQVDWEVQAIVVTTKTNREKAPKKLAKKTVTTGCGQGTMYGDLLEKIDSIVFENTSIYQSQIYRVLSLLTPYNEVYRESGAVHGCALCRVIARKQPADCHASDAKISDDAVGENDGYEEILHFVEDVGRHNAADSIAGKMWLNNLDSKNTWFYTTGRLTSEMVIKAAQMGISTLLSRSGITQMGLEMAQKVNMTLIARAKGQFFIVYQGQENVILDAKPK